MFGKGYMFVIRMTMVFDNEKLDDKKVWGNLYLVKTEQEARKYCIRHQVQANNESTFYKKYFMYEKLEIL